MFGKRFFQFGWEHGPFFERGDLKYVVLDLLKDKPSHGYEIIRAIEDRFHGFYAPSAGSVYPTLQMLEDMGYVTVAERDGKKVYTITDEGRKFAGERDDVMGKIRDQFRDFWGMGTRKELHETMHDLRKIGWVVGRNMHRLDGEKLARVREVIAKARQDIEGILEKPA